MDKNLQAVFASLQKQYADYYGVSNVGKSFYLNGGNGGVTNAMNPNFVPSKEIMFLEDVQAQNQFLQYCNLFTRSQKTGGSFRLGPQGRNTKTNNTAAGTERRVGGTVPPVLNEYKMEKAHFDWGIHDDELSDMSEFPNWHDMYRSAQLKAYGDDIQIVGFHGTSHATTSDMTANPMLEDVNKGWFQLLRERKSDHVFTGDANGEVKIGTGGHYKNVDQWVHDLYQAIPMNKRSAGMTCTMGGGVMAHAEGVYFREQGLTPTEKQMIQQKAITGVYGGLECIPAGFFFDNALMITKLKRNGESMSNLSVYQQAGTMQRQIEYVPKLERTVDWNRAWRAYHVEDLEQIVATDVEKVIFLDVLKPDGTPVEILKAPVGGWSEL